MTNHHCCIDAQPLLSPTRVVRNSLLLAQCSYAYLCKHAIVVGHRLRVVHKAYPSDLDYNALAAAGHLQAVAVWLLCVARYHHTASLQQYCDNSVTLRMSNSHLWRTGCRFKRPDWQVTAI
jgi:hypothetical protein